MEVCFIHAAQTKRKGRHNMNTNKFYKDQGYGLGAWQEMESLIDNCEQWYKNDVNKFHLISISNGTGKKSNYERHRLGMARRIVSDYADLLFNEKVVITVGNEATNKIIQEKVLYPNNFQKRTNELVEKYMYSGTGAFVLRLEKLSINTNNNQVIKSADTSIKIDYVHANKIKILSYTEDDITEVAFENAVVEKGINYLYISIHKLNDSNNYEIHNHKFSIDKQTGDLTPAEDTRMVAKFDTKSPHKWFAIARPNSLNNAHVGNPYGLPVFANAISMLKGADIVYDSLVNEFITGKKRIFVNKEAVKMEDGEAYFDTEDTVYYYLEGAAYGDAKDSTPKSMIAETDFTLRVDEHNIGIETVLNLLSSSVGLGEGYYSFKDGQVKTATEVVSDNSTLYRSITNENVALEHSIYDLMKSIAYIMNEFTTDSVELNPVVSIDFDDSIIQDKDAIKLQAKFDLSIGIISPVGYVMKTQELSEEQAIEFVKKQTALKGLVEMPEEEGGIE